MMAVLKPLKIARKAGPLSLMMSVLWSCGAVADEQASIRPCKEPQDRYETTYETALEPSRLFYADIGPHRYAVPWNYLHGRPSKVTVGCKLKGLGIQFWIPDGKAPERDLFWQPEFKPIEKDRPAPGPGEWVIKVTSIKYYEKEPDVAENVDRLINNIRQRLPTTVQENDLMAIKRDGIGSDTYALFQQESTFGLLFTCNWPAERDVCQGFINFKDKHLAVHFLTLRGSIQWNRNIIETLTKLLTGWELNN